MATAALIIAAASALGTIVAAVVASLAHHRAGQAKTAAERSAAAAEESVGLARAEHELRLRQVAALLELEIIGVGPGRSTASRAKMRVRNHGGCAAEEVRVGEVLINDTYFVSRGVAEVIPPGGESLFEADGPPGGVAGQLDRAEASAVSYIDNLGPHTTPLRWSRG